MKSKSMFEKVIDLESNTILILGQEYTINNDKDALDRIDSMGLCDTAEQAITLNQHHNRNFRSSILLHESIHAIDNALAINLTEDQVMALGSSLYIYLKENGLLS